jgi:hypothetical protein
MSFWWGGDASSEVNKMSSLYVRNKFRSWLNDATIDSPYYDTINTEQNPSDAIWVTAEFEVNFREKRTFCEGSWEEEGEVVLVFSGTAGVGDGALLAASEKDIKTLLAFRDDTGQLAIDRVGGVSEFSRGSANMSYQLEYIIEYTYLEK